MPILHRFVSAKSQSPDPTLVSKNEWNDSHLITGVFTEVTPSFSTAQIQAVLDLGGTVVFGDGNYTIGHLNITTPVRIQLGQVVLTNDGTNGDMFTSSGKNFSLLGINGRQTIVKPRAGYNAIKLTGNWYTGGTGLTERPHFNCEKVGFEGGLHAIYADAAAPTGLEYSYRVDDCDFNKQTGYSLYIGSSVFYSYVTRCTAIDTYGFADVYDNTESKFYFNVVEVNASGNAAYRFTCCHRIIVEGGDILGGRFGNINPDILVIPGNIGGSTTSHIASNCNLTLRNIRFGPELDQVLLIRPKVRVENTLDDMAAVALHIEDCFFYNGGGLPVTSITRAANVVTITVTLPVVPRFDGETYTSHLATVGSHIRFNGEGTHNEINGDFVITAVTGNTISFACTGANFGPTSITGAVVNNGDSRAVVLTNPLETSHITGNLIENFRYFIDTSASPGAAPYGKSGVGQYFSNSLFPLFCGATSHFTSGFRDFNRVELSPNAESPAFNTEVAPLQAIQTQNRIQESDISTWTSLGCTITGPVANGLGALTAFQIARDQLGSALSYAFTTAKARWTLTAGVSKLLVFTSGSRNQGNGVIQLRARGVGLGTCLTVGIIDKTTNLLMCCETLSLLDSTVWPAKVYRIPFAYRNGFDVTNTHVFIIPGYWTYHKATVIVDQVSVADLPCDFVRTVGAEKLDTNLGNIWTQDIALGGLRAVPGVEGAPSVTVTDGSIGAGGTVTIVKNGTSIAGTIVINTGTGGAATGNIVLTINKSLITPAIAVSLEDGALNWNARATVRVRARTTPANQINFQITWDNNAVVPTASTASALQINYFITQVTDSGMA